MPGQAVTKSVVDIDEGFQGVDLPPGVLLDSLSDLCEVGVILVNQRDRWRGKEGGKSLNSESGPGFGGLDDVVVSGVWFGV